VFFTRKDIIFLIRDIIFPTRDIKSPTIVLILLSQELENLDPRAQKNARQEDVLPRILCKYEQLVTSS
jgi:hypothetical protein